MATQNTKKEAARFVDGLVTQIVASHGNGLDADTARGLLLMSLKRVDIRRAIVEATNPQEKPTDEQLTDLHLPAKKPGRKSAKAAANPAACATATNAANESDDEDGDDDSDE